MGILCARCHALIDAPDNDELCASCRASEGRGSGVPKPSQKKPAFWVSDEELSGHDRPSKEPYIVQAPADHDSSIHDLASLMKESRAPAGAERGIDEDLLRLPTAPLVTAAPPAPPDPAPVEDPPDSTDEEVWFASGDMTPIDELDLPSAPPPEPAAEPVPIAAPVPRTLAAVQRKIPRRVGPWAGAAAAALLTLGWLAFRSGPGPQPVDAASANASTQPEATAVVQAAAPAQPAPEPAAQATPAPAQEPAAQAAPEPAPDPAPAADDPATAPAVQGAAAANATRPATNPQTVPAAGRKPFNRAAAMAALSSAASRATACRKAGDPKGMARVTVTFAPSGHPSQVQIAAPFTGTKSGACVASVFRGAAVPAFDGQPVPAAKGVSLR